MKPTTQPTDTAEATWRAMFNRLSMALFCLPNSVPDANAHVLRKADELTAQYSQETVAYQFRDIEADGDGPQHWSHCNFAEATQYRQRAAYAVRELIPRSAVVGESGVMQPFTSDLWAEVCALRAGCGQQQLREGKS